jgi:hypothetical protein
MNIFLSPENLLPQQGCVKQSISEICKTCQSWALQIPGASSVWRLDTSPWRLEFRKHELQFKVFFSYFIIPVQQALRQYTNSSLIATKKSCIYHSQFSIIQKRVQKCVKSLAGLGWKTERKMIGAESVEMGVLWFTLNFFV